MPEDTPAKKDQRGSFLPEHQCGAKLRKKNTTCKRVAMMNGRCRIHGGLSPKGAASPHTITGKYSKYLPQSLGKSYEASLKDPDLLKLHNDIALVDARVIDLLTQLKDGQENNDALAKLDIAGSKELWLEIGAFTDQRRKLVESERKRAIETQQVITTERLMALLEMITTIIVKHVRDKTALQRISEDIGELVH